MPEVLTLVIDKFTFTVPGDRLYDEQGVWVLAEGDRGRIGLSDFVQQRIGDIAFAEVKPVGSVLAVGDEVASVETVKTVLVVGCPVAGEVVEINTGLEVEPEMINQDPYGAGWLAVLDAVRWEGERTRLLSPEGYLAVMRADVEKEAGET